MDSWASKEEETVSLRRQMQLRTLGGGMNKRTSQLMMPCVRVSASDFLSRWHFEQQSEQRDRLPRPIPEIYGCFQPLAKTTVQEECSPVAALTMWFMSETELRSYVGTHETLQPQNMEGIIG